MPRIIEIDSLDAYPDLQIFSTLTENQLKQALDGSGLLIAESPKVIRVALDAGLEPTALLCERRHITGDAAAIIGRLPEETPVYTGSRELLASLTGYTLTRGVLCAMRRPEGMSDEEVSRGAKRVVVIDDVSDTTNIGAIFRSAAALGTDAILLGPTACDPFNRRSIRVSMGSVFLVPWARVSLPHGNNHAKSLPERLREFGFKTVAMALRDNSLSLDDPRLKAEPRLAIIMGTEGEGLPQATIDGCDYTVMIPMAHGIDSLNVAAAAAVACWELRPRH